MRTYNVRWKLVLYDVIILAVVEFFLMWLYRGNEELSLTGVALQTLVSAASIFTFRFIGKIYQQMWRYGGIQCYIRLIICDGLALIVTAILEESLLSGQVTFARVVSVAAVYLLFSLAIRMMYRYAYKCANDTTRLGKLLGFMLVVAAGKGIKTELKEGVKQTKIAIVGAGRIGVSLAEDLMSNKESAYQPRCFIDGNKSKAGMVIHGLPVYYEDEKTLSRLQELEVQEVVFTIRRLSDAKKKKLHKYYSDAGFKTKVYDYPTMQTADGRRHLREFDIDELLFRKPIKIDNEKTNAYYRDKVILITGGGGSIGSELSRQLAKMSPKQIILLDICENGAYDVQQELRIAYQGKLDIRIEICSITNAKALTRVFEEYHPEIVINAAAHKHVPLMEHNCVEAVENNVFGTKMLLDFCEKYSVERFMMVSTDKAVNPTNVMGATKRMCEMLVQSASTLGKFKCSSTRFGNVLGSAGSVIPLFKKQIASGGPITITDKRIIRYFMTIPEASQLVLQSGAMAENGELFVLDMGHPVKILDLAETLIRLSGVKDIEIIETGLRPGEKLYEELLVKTEELDKTENRLIFIERDIPISQKEIEEKLKILRAACDTNDDDAVREALKEVVPTYHTPEEINSAAEEAEEMKETVKA